MTATIRSFRGDAPAVAKIAKCTPAGVQVGTKFRVTCNGKYVEYEAAEATVADVVEGLVAALAATDIPEFAEMLASASDDDTYFTLVAVTPGVPFDVALSSTATTDGNVTVEESVAGEEAVNAVHKISLVGTYTGGTFTLSYNFGSGAETTSNIAYNATAAAVQTALEGLTTPVPGDVAVTGGPGPNSPWYVTWKGALGGITVTPGTVNGTNLTGNGGVSISTTTQGNGLSDEVQFLYMNSTSYEDGPPTYKLNFDGQTTAAISTQASCADIQAALEALSNIGSGNVEVIGDVPTGGNTPDWGGFIHFKGALAGTNVSTLTVSNYTGSQPLPPSVSVLQAGGQTTSDEFHFLDLKGIGGTFTVSFGGYTTPAISNLSGSATAAADLQTALQALPSIGANNATVTAQSLIGVQGYMIHLTGALANTRTATDFTAASTPSHTPTVTRVTVGQANTNEVQTITVFGTGGTFTLTSGAQTTSAIAWNAVAGTVDTRIEADLSATIVATTVTGSGTVASPYVVTVTNPSHTNIAQLTANGASLTGGGGTITQVTAGEAGVNEVQIVTLAAGVSGGTFTLAFNGATTSNLAYNASHGTVETALQALATVNTVGVAGSNGGPYTVTWSGAQGSSPQNLLVGDGSNLTGATGTQSFVQETTTFSAGPNHYDDALNWTGGRVPDSGDPVYFEGGDIDCLYGLRQRATVTVVAATDVITFGAADFVDDQIVHFTNEGGALPAGLAANTDYYLIDVDRDAGTCKVSATSGGAAVNITGTGTGTHTMGIRLRYVEVSSRHTAAIGLSRANGLGYVEYRPTELTIGLLPSGQGGTEKIVIGTGTGSGSSNLRFDTGPDLTLLRSLVTGGQLEAGIPPLLWKGTNPDNAIEMIGGDLGIAIYADEEAVFDTLTQRAGSVEIGANVTCGTIDRTGGQLTIHEAAVDGTVII